MAGITENITVIDETSAANEPRPDPADETGLVGSSGAVPQETDESYVGGVIPDEAGAEQPFEAQSETAEPKAAAAQEVSSADRLEESVAHADAEEVEEVEEEEEVDMNVEPLEQLDEAAAGDFVMDWYILKVQSNREETIRDALQRRVAVAGLDEYFGEVIVPTEDVAEFKNGKKRITKRKLYPGYIVVHMAINDDTWFLVRETPGIGDFTGSAGRPSPMLSHEVERIVQASMPEEDGGEPVKTAIPFKMDARVRIKEGTFENFEGEVNRIDEANGQVTVMINIFGRSTPVELEHWQLESL